MIEAIRLHGRELFGLGAGFGQGSGNACFDQCMVGQTLQQSEPAAAQTCAGNCGFLGYGPYVQCVTDNQDVGDSDPYGHCVECCAPNPNAPNPQNNPNPSHLPVPSPIRFPLRPGQQLTSSSGASSSSSASSGASTAAVVGTVAAAGAGAALLYFLLLR